MTTLYRPVLIETAEQAEALPVGARLMREPVDESDAGGMGYAPYSRNEQALVIEQFGERHVSPKELAEEGWMHLVPIEAEEERTRPVQLYSSAVHVAPSSSAPQPSRRLVTPWEEA